MVALRLFLPENWTSDPVRLKRAGVPIEHCTTRSKPEIALAEIDRVIAADVRFGCVLADAGYGSSAPLRHALSERGLLWAVGVSRRQKVYPTDVTMIFQTEKARKPRKHHIPDMSPVSAERMLVGVKWQKINWRMGTKGPLPCLFAARRVRIADGPKHRVFDKGVERMPGDEVWILGERRSSGEQKYYISNLPADVSCLDDDDRLRLLSISTPHRSRRGKKKLQAPRHNRACRPSDKPSSTSSCGLHQYDAPAVRC